MKSAFKAIAVIALATSSLVSVARAADSIVGTWQLVSWIEEETESKAVHKNFGDHPSGLVTFTSDGRMMIIIKDAKKSEADEIYRRPDSEGRNGRARSRFGSVR
jgi:Lipocalin-like domain